MGSAQLNPLADSSVCLGPQSRGYSGARVLPIHSNVERYELAEFELFS
jgi:hypothetical protein